MHNGSTGEVLVFQSTEDVAGDGVELTIDHGANGWSRATFSAARRRVTRNHRSPACGDGQVLGAHLPGLAATAGVRAGVRSAAPELRR